MRRCRKTLSRNGGVRPVWKRFPATLRCIVCHGELELIAIEERTANPSAAHVVQGERLGLSRAQLTESVESGLLPCRACKLWFPIFAGLPIMLPYRTSAHEEFLAAHAGDVRALGEGFESARERPVTGGRTGLALHDRMNEASGARGNPRDLHRTAGRAGHYRNAGFL